MARKVRGTITILQASQRVCRMVGRFGTAFLAVDTSPEFATAVAVFVAACNALHALDDKPYVIDLSSPAGPEDEVVL